MIFAAKHIISKIACALIYVGLLIVLFGSMSRAGMTGIVLSLITLFIIFISKKLRFWLPVIAIVAVSICSFLYFQKRTGFDYKAYLQSAFEGWETPEPALTRIDTLDDELVLTWNKNKLHIQFFPDLLAFSITDDDGKPVESTFDATTLTTTITDERFAGITTVPVYITEDIIGFTVNVAGNFAYYDNTYLYYTMYGKLIKHNNSETWDWLNQYGKFASSRGFIWAKTVPLLKDYILLGSGADTFVFLFPNNDFLAMSQIYYQQIITKPHSMYFQVWVQSGLLSLIGLLVFYFWYLGKCIKTSWKVKKHNFYSYISGGIAAGTTGYMFVQIFNDSSITVAPLFWAMIGIGLSACTLAKKESAVITDIPAEA